MKALRQLFWIILLNLAMATAYGAGASPSYPVRPVEIVVPYPPGGSADVLGRTLANQLGRALGQTFIVSNKPGAGTAVGTKVVAQSQADGYTLLIGTVSSHAMNPALTSNIGYDPVRDFTGIAPLTTIPFVLLANPKVGVNSLPALIDLARKQPGKLNFSSAGNGTSNHLAGEMLNIAANVQMFHVPYKGSAPALNALLSGEVDVMFDLIVTAASHVKSGAAQALAITTKERSPLLPNVPTVVEVGLPSLEVSAWFGLFAPSGVPADIRETLARETSKIVESAEFQSQLSKLGAMNMNMTSAQFPAFIASERDRWVQVVKTMTATPERR